ncbi:MAG: hypothetical protein IKT57_08610 [Clostridia bacterium]|nr:hypothetical protein [Clostridia bacterium]
MMNAIHMLNNHPQVSDYKINTHHKESAELFFVKSKLETVRRTDTTDRQITVYVNHGEYKGDAQFFVYPSTTDEQLKTLIDEAVSKALLINNKAYGLPADEQGEFEVESNFNSYDMNDLAAQVSKAVFAANTIENASLNAVEVFINKHTETIVNSRNLHKTQVRYDAMVEAIPTYNGEQQSVELYEQYNFSNFDADETTCEIAGKLKEVKARYEAVKPDFAIDCPVVFGHKEVSRIFFSILRDLNYSSVYSNANLFKKGDMIQKQPENDLITLSMAGETKGSTRSAKFDGDGLSLAPICLVENGKAINYYGSNRFGQYLGEKPTGELGCMMVAPGSAEKSVFEKGPSLEIASMSGLQVDFYNDYIGGEIRLAYYNDGEKIIPVTGISISGKVSEILNRIRFAKDIVHANGYEGPEKALLTGMKIF